MNLRKITLAFVLVVGCGSLVTGCIVVKHNPNYQPANRTYTSNNTAYWYYYPQSRVYYHMTERYYYYQVDGRWQQTRQLPTGWVLESKGRVRLKIAGAPYLQHAQHQRQYPSREVAHQNNVPSGHATGQQRAQDEHPVFDEHPGNRAGNPGMTHMPEHAAEGNGRNEHVPPGQVKFQEGKPGNNQPGNHASGMNQPDHGNADNAPGRNKNAKEFAQQRPEKENQGKNVDRLTVDKEHGKSQQAKSHGKPENNPHIKSADNLGAGKNSQGHQTPDREKPDHGKPEREMVKQERSASKGKKPQSDEVKQVTSGVRENPAQKHEQSANAKGKAAISDKPGRADNFKSHDMEPTNVETAAGAQSPIAVEEPKADKVQQASKNASKKQAGLTPEKGKGKPEKSKAAGNNIKQKDGDLAEEEQPANTKANKAKGKGR